MNGERRSLLVMKRMKESKSADFSVLVISRYPTNVTSLSGILMTGFKRPRTPKAPEFRT